MNCNIAATPSNSTTAHLSSASSPASVLRILRAPRFFQVEKFMYRGGPALHLSRPRASTLSAYGPTGEGLWAKEGPRPPRAFLESPEGLRPSLDPRRFSSKSLRTEVGALRTPPNYRHLPIDTYPKQLWHTSQEGAFIPNSSGTLRGRGRLKFTDVRTGGLDDISKIIKMIKNLPMF